MCPPVGAEALSLSPGLRKGAMNPLPGELPCWTRDPGGPVDRLHCPPSPSIKAQGPCSLLASPRSERKIVGSNVRPALQPVGRLVEQVWGRDRGRKLLIIEQQPAPCRPRNVSTCAFEGVGFGVLILGTLPWSREQPEDQLELPRGLCGWGRH